MMTRRAIGGAPVSRRRVQAGMAPAILTFLVSAALSYLLFFNEASPDAYAALAEAALLISGSAAFLVHIGMRPGFDAFSPVAAFTAMTAVAYGTGILYVVHGSGFWHSQHADTAPYMSAVGALALAGWIAYVLGYVAVKADRRLTIPGMTVVSARGNFGLLWVLLFGLGWGARVVLLATGVYLQSAVLDLPVTTMGIFGPFVALADGGLALAIDRALTLRKQQPGSPEAKRWRMIAVFSFLLEIGFAIPSGSKGRILTPIIVAAYCWNYAGRRLSFRGAVTIAAAAGAAFLFLSPIAQHYRDVTLETGVAFRGTPTMAQVVDSFVEGLHRYGAQDSSERSNEALDYAATRLNYAITLGRLLRYFDSGGSPAWGETYALTIWNFIPRVLYSDKPIIAIGRRFGIIAGYTDSGSTSIAITQMGELAFNFGAIGVPFGMFLFGALFAILHGKLFAREKPGEIVIRVLGFFVWYQLVFLGTESNFAGTVGGAAKAAAMLVGCALLSGFRFKTIGPVGTPPATAPIRLPLGSGSR